MEIGVAGEDAVIHTIIERLLGDYRGDLLIKERLPARGGQIKQVAPKINKMGTPYFLLADLDNYHCPPGLIEDWFKDQEINKNFLFRVAQEEAETWLMADREGFSGWLGVNIDLIPLPTVIDKRKGINEIKFPIKPSLFMMMNIVSQSSKSELKEMLTPREGAKKGPAYNSAMLPFIQYDWNIKNAALNSYSLNKTIVRLKEYIK